MTRRNAGFLERVLEGISWSGTLLHPATLFVVASALVIGGSIQIWNSYQSELVDLEEFQLTPDKIQLNESVILDEDKLKQFVLEQIDSEQTTTLLDTQLVSKTANAFQQVGWVERVQRIEKSKSGLEIELLYRNPIGMVELNSETSPNWGNAEGKLFPVDRNGVIMPGHLVAKSRLLRISIFDPNLNSGLSDWTPWQDERVKEAAAIGEVLQPVWQQFGLFRIVTYRVPNSDNDPATPFELWPDVGTQIIWGSAPGMEVVGEVPAAEKISLIAEFVARNGALDQLPKQKLDVRSGKLIPADPPQTADQRNRSTVDEQGGSKR
jgi:hypothetical protein